MGPGAISSERWLAALGAFLGLSRRLAGQAASARAGKPRSRPVAGGAVAVSASWARRPGRSSSWPTSKPESHHLAVPARGTGNGTEPIGR